jgi:biopolymer transport protein TolQ
MIADHSVIDLILQASPLVQAVMAILLFMSVAAWAVAFVKGHQFRQANRSIESFEREFWQADELGRMYNQLGNAQQESEGMYSIFEAGFQEFVRLKNQGVKEASDLVMASQRTMRVAFNKEAEKLENRLSFLATVGSSAPYIGLFGTVIGVMHAFQGIGSMTNATLEAVAPGIAEALLATGLGLFAAIPAVIFYNRYATKVDKILGRYESFAEEFLTILQRQAHMPS